MKQRSAKMLYVPDAVCYTIDVLEGSAFDRMKSNLLRWSGNVLRNGRRVILLGPRKTGLFVWWGTIDQQISMWTPLVAPAIAITMTLSGQPAFLLFYLAWTILSRLTLTVLMSLVTGRLQVTDPLFLCLNSYLNSLFRFTSPFGSRSKRWANRGNQKSSSGAQTR